MVHLCACLRERQQGGIMTTTIFQRLTIFLIENGFRQQAAEAMVSVALLLFAAGVAAIVYAVVAGIAGRFFKNLVARTRTTWDNKIVESGMVARAAHIAPLIVLHWCGLYVFGAEEAIPFWYGTLLQAYLLAVVVAMLMAAINSVLAILATTRAATMPLKGIAQAVKLTIYIVSGILMLSILLNRSPVYFFSGLTALTAVLMLIFKDSLLGLVAGIQISVNQMVQIGDWIEMPNQGADGDVIDVSLTTVKVRNWDKTITTIPAYALVSESFKNWRGMFDSGGRRIKRAIHIDMRTVKFADETMLAHWQKIRLLQPYLAEKLRDIAADNQTLGDDAGVLGNGRRLTNIGTFRAYCEAYLRANRNINLNLTFLVRQLQPTENGLPLEIYVFTNDTRWVYYERIQSDIFDHLIAILPEFELRAFQSPSGNDMQEIARTLVAGERR